jgi:hypothetical protein
MSVVQLDEALNAKVDPIREVDIWFDEHRYTVSRRTVARSSILAAFLLFSFFWLAATEDTGWV